MPHSQIAKQMSVLNQDFAQIGISWTLALTDRVIDANWYNNVAPGSAVEAQMKNALLKGGPAALNVYSIGVLTWSNRILKGSTGGRPLGYATFPDEYRSNPRNDGIVLETLTHEAGHWVGLYHTFQGGCFPPGDYVEDTPYEASPASGCPEDNFVDYNDDACLTTFTPGQGRRAFEQLRYYRGV
ncbi:hypothetical protein DXG01_003532 [Tephrocybe rancida]|nr:hypothetical protein DXG01_003532 [Tephrocybe rancida]